MKKVFILSQSIRNDPRLLQVCAEYLGENVNLDAPKDASVLLMGSEGRFDPTSGDDYPAVRCIVKYGVGLDNIDLEFAAARSIEVLSQAGVNAVQVAEMTLAMMLSLTRNLTANDRQMRQGIWKKNGGLSLSEHTVGLIGVGAIGAKVASLLHFFGARVLGYDVENRAKALQPGSQVGWDELLERSTMISLHCPLTDATRSLIDHRALAKMRRGVFLINTARGEIVDEDALIAALRLGQVAGAALDVYKTEPYVKGELLSFEQVILSPHSAGNSFGAKMAMTTAACRLARSYLESL